MLTLSVGSSALAADPDKVLHVALPIAETGFDPAAVNDLYSQLRQPRDLRHALRLRSSGASVQAGAQRRGGAARGVRRRQDLDDQGAPGHLLRRRSGVQGKEARAHGRRFRLFVEAHPRPEDALAGARGFRRQIVGGIAAPIAAAKKTGQVRLRRADRRPAGDRPLHDPAQARSTRVYVCCPT